MKFNASDRLEQLLLLLRFQYRFKKKGTALSVCLFVAASLKCRDTVEKHEAITTRKLPCKQLKSPFYSK